LLEELFDPLLYFYSYFDKLFFFDLLRDFYCFILIFRLFRGDFFDYFFYNPFDALFEDDFFTVDDISFDLRFSFDFDLFLEFLSLLFDFEAPVVG
jgi:hypothetical protein